MVKPVIVVPVELGAVPKWVQDSRRNRGLDPQTGRRPGAGPSPAAGIAVAVAVLAGLIVFGWIVIALVSTLLS